MLKQNLDTEGFVLAGGQSSRMGKDKALVSFAGKPLIAHALGILQNVGLDVGIAGARASLEEFAPVVQDTMADCGPLSGICAALAATSAERAVFLPVDMPLFPACIVRSLLEIARTSRQMITVASVGGQVKVFPAVIGRAALPFFETELYAGRRGCLTAFETAAKALGQSMDMIPVARLLSSGDVVPKDAATIEQWFFNVNTPAELKLAEHVATSIR